MVNKVIPVLVHETPSPDFIPVFRTVHLRVLQRAFEADGVTGCDTQSGVFDFP